MVERYFSQVVLHQGNLHRNAVVEMNGGCIAVVPYEEETAFTVFISGCIAVCNNGVNPACLTEMNAIVCRCGSVYDALSAIDMYLGNNGLYLSDCKKKQGHDVVSLLKYDVSSGWNFVSL